MGDIEEDDRRRNVGYLGGKREREKRKVRKEIWVMG
jgi:hypothetical protein